MKSHHGALWLLPLVLAGGCTDDRPSPLQGESNAPNGSPGVTWSLDEEQTRWVEDLRAQGGLRVASTESQGAYSLGKDPGHPTGFQADLARALGARLGLEVSFVTVPFETYFSQNGKVPEAVKTDASIQYEPDVFSLADLAAFNLSSLPWREKLMSFHPLFPTRVVLVTPRGREIRQLSDLSGQRVVVFANTSHEQIMRRLQSDLALRFELISVPFTTDLFALVREGKADAMVRDADGLMLHLTKNSDFKVSLALRHSEMVCWAISKKQDVFGSIIEKFLAEARRTGELASLWRGSYLMEFESYLSLIGDDPAPVWSEADQRVRAVLAKTGLRVAIDPEQTIYEPQGGTGARGVTYNLILEVAKRLEVPLRLKTVAFRDYFDKDGRFPEAVKTDPAFVYRPDLLASTDLYADTLSPLPWRSKFLAFVSLYPSKLVYVVRRSVNEAPLGDGKKIAVLRNSSYQDWLTSKGELEKGGLVLTNSGQQAVRLVAEGKAEATISDANLALAWMKEYPELTFLPADAEVQDLSWGVDKARGDLKALLDKVLDAMRKSGTFETIWKNYYGTSLDDYLGLLTAVPGAEP